MNEPLSMDAENTYDPSSLSRRERQIMDIIYSLGEASVNQVLDRLPDPPGRTAVRTLLRILEEKGHVHHRRSGREFIYEPTRPRKRAGISAFQHVLDIFYNGSLEKAVAAHLSDAEIVDGNELTRLEALIEQAKTREAAEAERERVSADDATDNVSALEPIEQELEAPQLETRELDTRHSGPQCE